jgi:hypothetical protein
MSIRMRKDEVAQRNAIFLGLLQVFLGIKVGLCRCFGLSNRRKEGKIRT